MNPRDRLLQTLLFGRPDRVPLTPGGPRESTLRAWHEQGLPADTHYIDALAKILRVPGEAFHTSLGYGVDTRMIPQFEEKVLEHKDGHYIVQDWMGAITEISDEFDVTYIRSAKDFVTRKWHKFPVANREDWENIIWRYKADEPARLADDLAERAASAQEAGLATSVSVNGPFWQMREWVGMENLCILMATEPEFVHEMAEFWTEFTVMVFERLLEQVSVDVLHMSEDMAYKAHSMISPKMAREFLQPTYREWVRLFSAHGCQVFDMDSDGEISELIPIWIESGFNCCDPIEVAAGNDIVEFRKVFGRRMAYRGGIDKRAIAAGGQTMRDEVFRVVPPLFEEGGFLPSCDHGVPPDISWPDFIAYTRLLAELTGWL
jgi:hypothetical protein